MKIKTHKPSTSYSGHHFFILSKGNNSGKPLTAPCPNCFVLMADTAAEMELLYWLCYGLWQGGCFRVYLCGSVIPFIHLRHLVEVISAARTKVLGNQGGFTKAIETLQKLEVYEENTTKQLKLARELKKAVVHKLLQ